ncbi:hypothetical protein BB558_005609 [Smittium angustum]|nr:hypothetical protein BB558_005609 [Smittium angustum]
MSFRRIFSKRILPQKNRFILNRPLASLHPWYINIRNDSTIGGIDEIQFKHKIEQYEMKATEKLRNGEASEALELYLKANSLQPNATLLYNIGVCKYQLGQIDEALSTWEKSLEVMPMVADVHVNMANVYFLHKKSADKAIKHLGIASSLSPNDGEISYNYGCILDASGNLEEALVQYKSALENGISKAEVNIRNIMIKLSAKKA